MIRADGSYPTSFDSRHGPWKYVMPISQVFARMILFAVAQAKDELEPNPDGAGYILVNKMFRVFQQGTDNEVGEVLWAIYNHDGQHHIIKCPVAEAKNLSRWDVSVGDTTEVRY